MSTSRTDPGSPEAFAATQDAIARCRRYRKDHGLYGLVDPALGRIMLEVGAVGAVVMPAPLGERVRALLARDQASTGPVIAHPRSGRWTFLTGPTDSSFLDTALFSDLFRVCASVALPGTRVVLPSPADEQADYRLWIDPPQRDFRPLLGDVVAATRACSARIREPATE
ncbi:hypothetical protein [Nocardia goodfellowii]|uniref:DNA-directed RNA polymerase subunit beta n=1 Tax=Nocardia goodfellowii TaxID=882446 RepID=A0ABS4Q981_9NOCA|nr:hypothetical protein [Nocardia goodfellowii]MBP2188251.1 hypothetical protein [Nocardia goodfellowii]